MFTISEWIEVSNQQKQFILDTAKEISDEIKSHKDQYPVNTICENPLIMIVPFSHIMGRTILDANHLSLDKQAELVYDYLKITTDVPHLISKTKYLLKRKRIDAVALHDVTLSVLQKHLNIWQNEGGKA